MRNILKRKDNKNIEIYWRKKIEKSLDQVVCFSQKSITTLDKNNKKNYVILFCIMKDYVITWTNWRPPPSPCELTPIKFDMELTHFYTEAFKSYENKLFFAFLYNTKKREKRSIEKKREAYLFFISSLSSLFLW